MKNSTFRPTQNEINAVTATARRDGRRAAILGAAGGGIAAGLLRRKSKVAKIAGALAGAVGGNVVGRAVGRRQAASDVRRSRDALLQKFAAIDDNILFAAPDIEGILDTKQREIARRRAELASIWGWGVVGALSDEQLDDHHASRLSAQISDRIRAMNQPNAGNSDDVTFARRFFEAQMGQALVAEMGDREIMAHFMSAKRRGLIELDLNEETTDFGISERLRNQDGEFAPGGGVNSAAVQRAYGRDRKTGRSVAVGAAGATAGLAAAVLAHRRLKRAKLPRLSNGRTIDVPTTTSDFARRNMPASPFGGPRKLIRRPRRGAKLLAHFGIGGATAAEGLVDALGLGGIGSAKKKKKPVYDADGNLITPQQLPDPGTTSTASFSIANAARYLPEAGVIAGADLTAEELHDAISRARDRKKKRLRQNGIAATPGMNGAPQTMSAIHETLHEFDSAGKREAARRHAETLGASVAGGTAGAAAGLFHDQGEPVRARDLRPGDQVYRRQGPLGAFQHTGVVDEDGKVVHRSRGSSVSRAVKPESFLKGGRGPLRRERHADDLPRAEAARNATAAAGTRQGRYSLVGENCQHAATRIASRGVPVSRQLRKTLAGGAAGALAVGSAAAILGRRKQNTD